MEVEITSDSGAFVARCTEWLNAVDAPYHSLLSIAYASIDGYASFVDTARFGILTSGSAIRGCWVQVRDGQLHIPSLDADAIEAVCKSLVEDDCNLTSVSGYKDSVCQFAEVWRARKGARLKRGTEWQLMYAEPPAVSAKNHRGHMRLAIDEDLELVRSWSEMYEQEKPAPMSIVDFLTGKLERQELYLWEDREPVCMMATTTRIAKQARLVALYTPLNLRRSGYGSMLVRELVTRLFEDGYLSCAIAFDTADQYLGPFYESLGFQRSFRRLELVA